MQYLTDLYCRKMTNIYIVIVRCQSNKKYIIYTITAMLLPVEEWLASLGLAPDMIVEIQVVPASMSWINLHKNKGILNYLANKSPSQHIIENFRGWQDMKILCSVFTANQNSM